MIERCPRKAQCYSRQMALSGMATLERGSSVLTGMCEIQSSSTTWRMGRCRPTMPSSVPSPRQSKRLLRLLRGTSTKLSSAATLKTPSSQHTLNSRAFRTLWFASCAWQSTDSTSFTRLPSRCSGSNAPLCRATWWQIGSPGLGPFGLPALAVSPRRHETALRHLLIRYLLPPFEQQVCGNALSHT